MLHCKFDLYPMGMRQYPSMPPFMVSLLNRKELQLIFCSHQEKCSTLFILSKKELSNQSSGLQSYAQVEECCCG